MKKKHRDITVDGVKYAWTLYGGGKEHDVTIWKDKKEWFTSTLRLQHVTPKDVADLIKARLKWEKLEEERPQYGSLRRMGQEQEKIDNYDKMGVKKKWKKSI